MVDATSVAHSVDAAADRWSPRLVRWMAVLTFANLLADAVVIAPLLVLPQMLEHFETSQAAWLNASAMLAGAMWAPLLGRSADIYGKRRILVLTLLVTFVGSLVCLFAPNVGIFVFGRFLQGAAVGAVLLSVAITRQLCTPRIAMPAVGVVTSGSSILGLICLFLLNAAIPRFGYQSVFATTAGLALASAFLVRLIIPATLIRTSGSIDIVGALLLGGGLAAVLGYVSLGPDLGWLGVSMLALLVAGAAAMAAGVKHVLRTDEPIIDVRGLHVPMVLTLLAVALAAGSTQSMLQLKSLVGQVSPDLGLGYGLGGGGVVLALFAVPAIGIMLGGPAAGVLATRIGPARTMLAGIGVGTVATFGMLAGVSLLPVALGCATLLGIAAGATITSGYNLATSIAPPEHHGAAGSLVTVMLAVGSVVLNVAGAAILAATDTDTVADGAPVNSLTGVHLYVVMAGCALVAAAAIATSLVRRR